ncbi:unnamed protein product [Allacma fusca]|nr:unnamed protein product [Allacma fusca]
MFLNPTLSLGNHQPPPGQLPFGPLYLRKHAPIDTLAPSASHMLPHRIPHPWSPHLSYFPSLASHHSAAAAAALNYRNQFLNPAAAYLPGPQSFQNLLAQLNGACAAAAAASQQGNLLPNSMTNQDILLRSNSLLPPSPENSDRPRTSSPVGSNSTKGDGSENDFQVGVTEGRNIAQLERRNSSIHNLRVKAREHEMTLEMLRNGFHLERSEHVV